MRKITVYSECRADEGLLQDLRDQIQQDSDLELSDNGDILIVLGDRAEPLRMALKYLENHKPTVHISGGEKTSGVIDDSIRHAITKLSMQHFVATEEYRRRVIQLGEDPDTVHWVGEPGLDNIPELTDEEPCYLVTYHPTTDENPKILFNALMKIKEKIIITYPNTDRGYEYVIKELKEFAKCHPRTVRVFKSMGRVKYLSTLKNAIACVGNSSSGIVEAAMFNTPVINIGKRQDGRIKPFNVVDVPMDKEEIIKELHDVFRFDVTNPYYKDGKAIPKILKVLKTMPLTVLKEFHDNW